MTNGGRENEASILNKKWKELTERERQVLESIKARTHISKNVARQYETELTFGERIADKVASFGGSWTFIFLFGAILLGWMVLNTFYLAKGAFDPYPYILLNLILSTLAALQAPVIMMSQNRQADRDRMDAAHDYQINLKAELEIRRLQEALDELREIKWLELIELQTRQIELLERLSGEK
ncbi:MAG: DUF1003 domain-containing protein [Pyrinomonadaceae bacterium]